MKVERLRAEHYDEMIGLLNSVFSRKNKREMDFEKEIPKMCARDDENMGKHIGIFDDGRLIACMGIYPFDTQVLDEELKFATTGNIAVHWDYEGRGYMGEMLDFAMQELDRLKIDVARLGGLRSRYNRYGFESCGQAYCFTFTAKNRLNKLSHLNSDVCFKQITPEDKEWIAFSSELYNKNAIRVPRTPENAYLSLTMWQNTPYIALIGSTPIGYLSTKDAEVAEIFGVDTDALANIVCSWQKQCDTNVTFSLQAHQIDAVRFFTTVCEYSAVRSPSHFFIRNFEKTVDAFLKLKASYQQLPAGELRIGISDYGTIRLVVDGAEAYCERTDLPADITLDRLSVHRYIFGPFPPVYTAEASALAQAWFPLPLGWNGQDRV